MRGYTLVYFCQLPSKSSKSQPNHQHVRLEECRGVSVLTSLRILDDKPAVAGVKSGVLSVSYDIVPLVLQSFKDTLSDRGPECSLIVDRAINSPIMDTKEACTNDEMFPAQEL